ncbi:tetratricopeptide repeat protein [Desulfovibrio mangrovi]|uniref:tetratricopeptide repeat protein n=1 Tax=Desulfovibrio mangrovi TaxID=2976983 RepID=UPI0022460672|nr:tetratricopeptide repeat protein [Desulfovibrio mangrovi]UZP67440.1 tetratricopeptide repeat protein [Desulfovibrio mangrovi]
MEIDNFRGVYSSRETDHTSQTPGATRTRKRYWLVWDDTDETVLVQPLSASLEPSGVKRIIPVEDLDTLYVEEPSVVPSFSQPHLTEPDGWERITAASVPDSGVEGIDGEGERASGDDVMKLPREVRRQAIDLDDTGFLAGLEEETPASGTDDAFITGRDARRQPAAPADAAADEKERELRAAFGLALMEFKRGNRAKALRLFEDLTKESGLVTAHKHVFTDFGISLRKSKLLDMALKHHLKAVALSHDDENAYHNVARIYYELGDMDNALRYLQKSLELNPSLIPSERFMRFIRRKQKGDRTLKLDM